MKVPGFLLLIQAVSKLDDDMCRIQLTALSIAVLDRIEKAFECAQRGYANMRVLTCSDLL